MQRLIGYHIDGRLYDPEDVELVYEAADDEAPPPNVAGSLPDLQQAIQVLRQLLLIAETEALSGYPLEDDPMNAAVKTAIGALEQLQAAQAENQQLRDLLQRARMYMPWPTYGAPPKLTRLHNEILAVLEHHAALGQVDQPCECGHGLDVHPPGFCTTCGIVQTPNGVKTLSGKCMGWHQAALGQVERDRERS